MKFLREIPIIVLLIILAGCASVKRSTGPNQVGAQGILPSIKSREIKVEIVYTGPEEVTPHDLKESVYSRRQQEIATRFRSDLESAGFKIVNNAKTKIKVVVNDYTNASWWRGGLSGLTLGILPGYYSDKIVVEFQMEGDKNAETIKRTFESVIDIASRQCILITCINKHGLGYIDDPIWQEEYLAIRETISKFIGELSGAEIAPR